uniref:Phospholipid/glycerol acyltransferase domain-containing protein n=2 Tax=Planktothrix pseudagardhii TaxID=132604 RepID=A0A9W4GAE8_9CYAN|nr:hypothetical protein NO713_04364 [Planktothrix pseudagardhii]
MFFDQTGLSCRWLVSVLGIQMFISYEDRIPETGPAIVVSNHRSVIDPIVLTAGVGRTLRFASHHYMGQVPLLRELVTTFGAFPFDEPEHRPQQFFKQATQLLNQRQMVGIFPEGATPMLQQTQPNVVGTFQRGFAHLALRSGVCNLAVLPVAIATLEEQTLPSAIPLRLLRVFDPTEPLFDQPGWHPMILYRRIQILIGRPYWITPRVQRQYQGKQARKAVEELTQYCHREITDLLRQGSV